MIPLVDLKAQYVSIAQEIQESIQDVLESQEFILGKKVQSFEKAFATMHKAPFCAGCSNGTSAISLALEALGVGKGDEVITAVNSFVATSNAILKVGAIPVFVDCDKDSYLIDDSKIEQVITKKTKAIIPVHLYGQMCAMENIKKIATKHSLCIVEDSAQAHMATHNGNYPGFYGDIATFSFYPGKNLGAYGDAGAIITHNETLFDKICMLRNHGRAPAKKYEHDIIGSNERMDDIQASILLVKLNHLKEWTNKRQEASKEYTTQLESLVKTPFPVQGNSHVWHLYVIEVEERNRMHLELKNAGIAAGIHYPIPLHLQPCNTFLGHKKGDFPVAEHAANHILSLPLFPELTKEQISTVCSQIRKIVAK